MAVEAIRIADLLAQLLPDDDEVQGLRALLYLQHARRAARLDLDGDLVTLDEQERGQWDGEQIVKGLASLAQARDSRRAPGPYRLQAEIAAVHAQAADAASTDWGRITAAYDALLEINPSPVVALNRAVAVSFRDGAASGLEALAAAEATGALAGYPLLDATRADFLRRAERTDEAVLAYRRAIVAARSEAERRLLERRLAALPGGEGGRPPAR